MRQIFSEDDYSEMNESNVAIFWLESKNGPSCVYGTKLGDIIEEFIWGCLKVKGRNSGRDHSGKSFSPGNCKVMSIWQLAV